MPRLKNASLLVTLLLVAFLAQVCLGGDVLDFNDNWRFAKGRLTGARTAGFDDSGWAAFHRFLIPVTI